MQQRKLGYLVFYTSLACMSVLANIIALLFQFLYYDLPCPLCLLQRFGLLGVGFGAILSLKHPNFLKNNLIIVLSSFFVLAVSLRQILLHIAPNDPGYGKIFFGLHFYTWSALLSFFIILSMSISALFNRYFKKMTLLLWSIEHAMKPLKKILIGLVLVNIISTYLECGLSQCQDNPTVYLKLHSNN